MPTRIETIKVALRGFFAKLHFEYITDSYDAGFHQRERRNDDDHYYLISFDLYLDCDFTRLLVEDQDAIEVDDAFLAELLDARELSDALTDQLKSLCVSHARALSPVDESFRREYEAITQRLVMDSLFGVKS